MLPILATCALPFPCPFIFPRGERGLTRPCLPWRYVLDKRILLPSFGSSPLRCDMARLAPASLELLLVYLLCILAENRWTNNYGHNPRGLGTSSVGPRRFSFVRLVVRIPLATGCSSLTAKKRHWTFRLRVSPQMPMPPFHSRYRSVGLRHFPTSICPSPSATDDLTSHALSCFRRVPPSNDSLVTKRERSNRAAR